MLYDEYDGVILKPPLDDVLEHHGVKGMKWGIRKQKVSTGLARRRVNTGEAVSEAGQKAKSIMSKIGKNVSERKKRMGYSEKTYQKYKKKGMSDSEAVEAAKKSRKKKVAAVAIGAAALTIGVLAARKHNINVQNAKRLANQTGDTKALEKQLKENAKKAKNAWKDYKFDDADHYARAKRGALEQKWTVAVQKAGGDQTKIDPKKIKVSGNEVKKYAHDMTQRAKQASERVESQKLKNRVKRGAQRWWNGQ